MRTGLQDDSAVVFTHSDLHTSNVIVPPMSGGQPRIRAIIDWYQTGWYPDYWEYCKLLTTGNERGGWEESAVDQILDCPTSLQSWYFYMECLCWS